MLEKYIYDVHIHQAVMAFHDPFKTTPSGSLHYLSQGDAGLQPITLSPASDGDCSSFFSDLTAVTRHHFQLG